MTIPGPRDPGTYTHPLHLRELPGDLARDFTAALRRDIAIAVRESNPARLAVDIADLAAVLDSGSLTPAQCRRARHKANHAMAGAA